MPKWYERVPRTYVWEPPIWILSFSRIALSDRSCTLDHAESKVNKHLCETKSVCKRKNSSSWKVDCSRFLFGLYNTNYIYLCVKRTSLWHTPPKLCDPQQELYVSEGVYVYVRVLTLVRHYRITQNVWVVSWMDVVLIARTKTSALWLGQYISY